MSSNTEWLLREKYSGEKTRSFYADCARLEAGEPVAYVIGHIPFLDCTIWLDSHPLIPRPETEYWTEHAIAEIKNISSRKDLELVRSLSSNEFQLRILDLCAGSGAIGIAVAKAIPQAHVTFAEIEPAHLSTIEKNLNQNGIGSNRWTLWESDLFTNFEQTQTFDFILTNPPYIDNEAHTVDASVTTHEPHLALFGGLKGMEIIEQIMYGARDRLTTPTTNQPSGQLWIEHEPFQTATIHALAETLHFRVTTHEDQYHTPRYSIFSMAQ